LDLDLTAHQVTNLEIVCDLPLSKEEFEQIKEVLPPDALVEGRLLRHSDYNVGRRRYHEFASLRPRPDGSFSLSLGILRASGRPIEEGRIADLLEALAPLERKARLGCLVEFTYLARRWSSIIRLPLRLSEWSRAFDEVRGIRVVKLSPGKELEYSAILDRVENRNYRVSLGFAYDSLIDPSVPQRVLQEATRISRLLIKPRSEV
jgi:hypothetical protein